MLNFRSEPISPVTLKFIFLLCPNNSGTTVLSQYLAEQIGGYLPKVGNNEGQMLPAVRDMMRNKPWDENQKFDWHFIREEWERKCPPGHIFVESSPPNIMRVDDIADVFGHDSTAILSISDPYQQVASSLRRYQKPGFNPAALVDQWLAKARKVLEIQETYPHFPLFSYDDFVADPQIINRFLDLPYIRSTVQGKKGSGGDGIRNMRAITTLFLQSDEIDAISERLAADEGVVERFGYKVVSGADLIKELGQAKDALKAAQVRRDQWNSESAA